MVRACRRAFTLIELLVVVAIIALLVSILLPSLAKAREQARMTQCLSSLKQMGIATYFYADDHKGTLPGPLHPAIYRDSFRVDIPDSIKVGQLLYRIRPYLAEKKGRSNLMSQLTKCPTSVLISPDSKFAAEEARGKTGLRPFSYCLNTVTLGKEYNPKTKKEENVRPFGWYSNASVTELGPVKLDRIRWPSEEWSMADAFWRHSNLQYSTYTVEWSGAPLPRDPYHGTLSSKNLGAPLGVRKTGRTNCAYFDGHGGTVPDWRGSVIAKRLGSNP